MKRRLTVRDLFFIVLAVSAAYWISSLLVEAFLLNDILDGALIALCFVVTYQYLHWSFMNFSMVADRGVMLRSGIVLAWLGTGIWRLERFMLQERAFGYEGPIGLHDPLRGFMISLLIVGAVFHIMAFSMVEAGRPKAKNNALWIGAMLLGVGVVSLLRLT